MCWYLKDSKVVDFLYTMSKDSAAAEQFKADPHAAMAAAGLNDEERNMIMTNDPQHLVASLLTDTREA